MPGEQEVTTTQSGIAPGCSFAHGSTSIAKTGLAAVNKLQRIRNGQRCYFFGDGRTLQVVIEQDEGHEPRAELQTGQNRTVQVHLGHGCQNCDCSLFMPGSLHDNGLYNYSLDARY
jgi:hypothetical protein